MTLKLATQGLQFLFSTLLIFVTFQRSTCFRVRFSQRLGASVAPETHVEANAETIKLPYIQQKNVLLMQKFTNPENGNLTKVALDFVNFCDESFDMHLNEKINALLSEQEKQVFGRIRYEINSARQRKLREADVILRGILSSGGLKQMEAKLAYHLRRAEISMPFMVILQLNIEDAAASKSETAVRVLTHLETMINEHQDSLVSPPVRLLRLLVRTEDPVIRKQMLRQKLLIGNNVKLTGENVEVPASNEPLATPSPQCEHIVVQAVSSWGAADVKVKELEDTIADIQAQILDELFEQEVDRQTKESGMIEKCETLRKELAEVVAEVSAPKVSDQCDNA